MPVYLLCIQAELENIASLKLKPDAEFMMDVREAGGSEVRAGVVVSGEEEQEVAGGRGTAHFVMKFCKESKSQASITIMDPKDKELKGAVKGEFTAEDRGKWVALAAFECRGLEPIAFTPQAGWIATSAVSSTKWEDVDLAEKEWAEYDEKGGESVGVSELQACFKLHK
uniref:Uncharacterized protein n=1 Tax=Chlamydomonas leiostraca TaxID=1034604 RepID=A0A7S0WN99_9CHLO|mmetsp:Transcript_20169/g.51112  ORF Transcript_20169/g.51112 Transcript_20169/m.51112 type:complete len:169 (+) Transcript_20169:43-549(+)